MGASVLSEVRLATMQQGEGLKEEGIHHIDLCSLEGLRALTKGAASRRTLQFHLSLNGNKLSRLCSEGNMNTQLAVGRLTLTLTLSAVLSFCTGSHHWFISVTCI